VVVLAALTLVSMLIVSVVMVVTDPVVAAAALRGESVTTPLAFLWNNISIAFFIPIAVLVSWLFYRQGFGWLVSVTGRARWRWFGLVLGVFIVGYAVNYGISTVVYGVDGMGWTQLSWQSTSLFLIVSVLVTTPFQCAGEEFLFRGALSRLIGGIIPAKWVGLVASAVLSSAAFMALHSASDVWLNINYFSVGLMMWWLAYRTGGLEASIAFHVVNNLFAEISLPFTDISGMFDREAGSASALVLIDLAFQVIMVVIVDILARRWGLVRQSSPAALTPQVVRPKRWFTPVGTLVTEAAVTDLPRLATTVRESPALVQPPMWGYVGSTYPLQTQAYPPQAYPPPSAQVYPPPSGTPAWPAPGIAPAAGYATPPPAPTPAPTPTPMHTPTLPLAPTPMHTPTPSLAPTPAHAPTLTPTPTPVYTPTPPPAPGQSPWVAPPPGSVPPWATPAGYPPSTDGVSPGPDTISPSSPDLSSSTDGNPPPRPAIPPRSVT
jgi:membrane protease YdiL (CAAX protease family)